MPFPSQPSILTCRPHAVHVLLAHHHLHHCLPLSPLPFPFPFQNLPEASRRDPSMANPPSLKRPKLEKDDDDSAYWPRPTTNGVASVNGVHGNSSGYIGAGGEKSQEEYEEEAAAVALVEHRKGEVAQCKLKLLEYQTLLDEAEKRLEEAYARQARIQAANAKRPANDEARVPQKQTTPTPVPAAPLSRVTQQQMQPAARPQLVIPAVSTRPVLPPQPRVSAASRAEAVSLKRAMPASSVSSSGPPQPKVAERPKLEANRPKRKIGNVIES